MVQQRWADAALAVAFEDLAPVSAFPVIPGRRWGPGLWWSATTGRHVSAGSNAMRTQLIVLDRDPRVTALAGRPVRLLWHTPRGQVRSWVPQIFARYTDGTALLADCPSHPDAGGKRALGAAEAVAEACAQIGWSYRRLPPLDDILAANLKWLAGYRHPRNAGRPGLREAVLEAFARPRPLLEGAEAVGDPIEVLPAVFHALWHRQLTTDLETPLHERAMVGPGSLPHASAGVPAGRLQEDAGEGEDGYAEETGDISETAEDADTNAGGDEAGAQRGEAV
ncbi:TnsA-like heteromeric transposase endonuclease subunit [Streptomyces sp. NPDC003753]